jgi:hypothetical protein
MNSALENILATLQNTNVIRAYGEAKSVNPIYEDANADLPKILHHPLKEDAGPNRLGTEAVSQVTTIYFVLISVCPLGGLEAVREALLAALVGKVFGGSNGVSEVIHVEGEVLEVTATAIWWRDIFSYRLERRVL